MIAEAVLLDALEAVHSGRLRVHEAYRTIRAAESVALSSDSGLAKQVWAVRCAGCNTWLPEWNSELQEAEQVLREHQDEMHD